MGRLPARERLGENALFLVDAVFRDDQLPQEVVHRLGAGVAEDRFGTRLQYSVQPSAAVAMIASGDSSNSSLPRSVSTCAPT